MKPITKVVFIVIAFTCFGHSSTYAQTEDYVITNTGDTIRCYVDMSPNLGTAKYKTPNGKYQKN